MVVNGFYQLMILNYRIIMKNKIYYGKAIYGKEEINASTLFKKKFLIFNGWQKCKVKKMQQIFGKKYGLMVNSGSSADLLALAALNLPEKSEVITPSLLFQLLFHQFTK